jgi:hypothetical protein
VALNALIWTVRIAEIEIASDGTAALLVFDASAVKQTIVI